ncbi:MAG: outer membrane lipoprotein-sorting protein [Gemmatimonadota bacterium]
MADSDLNGAGADGAAPDRKDDGTAPSRVARYADWVIRRRWPVLAIAAALVLAAAAGARHLSLATNYRVFFTKDNPDLVAWEEVENVYTKNDNVLFVLKPRSGDVFQPRVLEAARSLTEDAWQIPHSTRVDGITNFQHTWADGDELIVEDLLPAGPITPEAVRRVRDVSLSEPLIVGRLMAEDGGTTGVNVRIALPGESSDELPATVAKVRELEAEYQERYPDIELHVTGIAMLNWTFAESPQRDMPTVMPLMFAALVLAMIAFLRSFSGTAATLVVVGASAATAVGIAGYMGVQLDPTSASAPTIILTLAVADSIHILVTFFQALRGGASRNEAIREALVQNALPVFLTSVTTAIGFLSLNFSDSPPFRLLGNLTAFGVMVAWVYSMTVLPALLAVLPVRARAGGSGRLARALEGYSGFVVRRHRAILALTTIATVAVGLSIARMRINDQYFEYFSEDLAFRQATDFTLEHLTGLYGVTYSLPAGEPQGVSDPEYLAAVSGFTDWLEGRPHIKHVNSFTHVMKRLNKNLHADDPDEYRLPEDHDLAAQYLLLYEMSLPYGLDLNDQIDIDKSSLRVDATYEDVDVAQMNAEVAAAEAWLDENGTPAMGAAIGTGPSVMFSKITQRNIASMILGTTIGFALIALILTFALRSVRMGLISLIPNVLPAAVAFGAWAWLVGEVGFAVSVVTGLAMGIIVDDTVHFLTKYNRVRASMSAEDAVRYAFRSVGAAIVGTTLIVTAGFAMLGLSTFRVTAYMGLLTSLTIVAALAVDFLLLPALLIALDRRPVKSTGQEVGHIEEARTHAQWRRPMIKASSVLVALAAASALFAPATAQTPEQRGRQVAEEADRQDAGWRDDAAELRMILRNRNGDESIRELRRQSLETSESGRGDKSVMVFDAPRDIRGTALLSHTRILEADDQWLYLPALKRVKRISSANKSGPFVGSEFAYEDLVSQEVDKYEYRWLRTEPCGDLTCAVVERYPLYDNSGYTRQVVWWDTTEYRAQRVEYYDRKDAKLKTLTYDGYASYADDYWRPDAMVMVNHQNGKSTELRFAGWAVHTGVDERAFTATRLRSAR